MDALETVATVDQLRRYAEVIVNCGLGHGVGIRDGDIVLVSYNQGSALLVPYLQAAITAAGGHLLHDSSYDFPTRDSPEEVLMTRAAENQLVFGPQEYNRALYSLAQHLITLKCLVHIEASPQASSEAMKQRRRIRSDNTKLLREFREQHWQSYTLAYVPTTAMAREAGASLSEFWEVIVDACHLDHANAIHRVRAAQVSSTHLATALTALQIRKLHIEGPHADLSLQFEPSSRFVSSEGGNTPSFEVFSAPRASKSEGWISSQFPSLFEGTLIDGARFEFEDGRCVKASAHAGESALQNMLAFPGMNTIGEIAFTDSILSAISRALPGATLFLENIGGTGHFAFGNAIAKCYEGSKKGTDANTSSLHLDFVFSGDCVATATLADGSTKVVFKHGRITL